MTSTRRAIRLALVTCAALVPVAVASDSEQRHPVYVGARVCATCHEGKAVGHQFSEWMLSRHARAYASLALPEAKAMARLSGIPEDPQQAVVCLGCHATAAEAEDWERDPTFHLEDGVQCEKCHGPGSEYMALEVMTDRKAAARAGLRYPDRECGLCHYVKGSHVAIHDKPALDLVEARQRLAHPTPESASPGSPPQPVLSGAVTDGAAQHVGVHVCGACHRGPAMGYQFSRWRLGPHARAYAVLATPRAYEIAGAEGIATEPGLTEACLACHSTSSREGEGGFAASFSVVDGVGCESCHGAGSEYAAEAIMLDRRAARAAGMKPIDRKTCERCHAGAHGKPFDHERAVAAIAHPTRAPDLSRGPTYKTPVNLAESPDGAELYVACEASGSVIVVDARQRRKLAEIPVGAQPNDVAFSPDGATAYVTNRLDDTVSVIDTTTREVRATIPVGDEPHGLLTDRTGARLFVLNTAEESISVVDTDSLEESKRLAASRNPWSLAISPDGRRILVTNNLSRFVAFREPSSSEVTVLDGARAVVEERLVVPDTNLIQGIDWHPGGEFALITLNRTKNLVPMTRILQGWTITNGLGILWADGRLDQVLLDEPNLYFPDAADVAVSPDGKWALVTSSGSDRVAVVDVTALLGIVRQASDEERERILPNHLGKSTEFVTTHIATGNSPRGVVVSRDGRRGFVANALDDSLTVIDMADFRAVERIDLGGPDTITRVRRGERLFHSADIAFQRQFSCHSCHPDGHVDSITYDIEPDGIGLNPVDNRTLRGILDTAPFKWEGTNPSLSRQCGPRLAVFFTRIDPFAPDELEAVEAYIRTIPRPPNRHRPFGADLTAAQRRGKRLFERTRTNDGRIISEDDRCVTCHFPPLFTDRTRRDVGTRMRLDVDGVFDVPHLSNIYDSAPYLHNGISPTLEEIWTRYNPDDKHGVTNDMTKDQLNDLIEYLKTL